MIHFSSDHHFHHSNILAYQPNRSKVFPDIYSMNQFLIDKWNNQVGEKDIVYYLGDLCLANYEHTKEIVSKLNGRIRLIKGNHDSRSVLNKLVKDKLIEWWKHYYEVKEDGNLICLFHYPIETWHKKEKGSLHLFGHVHSTYSHDAREMNRRMDVGVDNIQSDFKPFSYEYILETLK